MAQTDNKPIERTAKELQAVVDNYIDGVISGKIVTGKYQRQAVDRHVRDMQAGESRGLEFSPKNAAHAINFIELLKHSKGEWAGRYVHLEPWEVFICWCVFGWKWKATGFRRFKTAYNELARKNGKSTFAAGIGLYLLVADGEPGAEVYNAATKRDQAKIVHTESIRMVRAHEDLKQVLRIYKDNIVDELNNSKYEPLGADADTLDGLNPNGVIIDELHAHKNRKCWDVLETATGARRQPLLFAITTAGFDQEGICYEQRGYALRVLSGDVIDDSFFAFIATLDEGDDWKDESVWIKANPNLGVTVKIEELREKANKAKETPRGQNNFRTKRLNQWTAQDVRFIDMDKWAACSEEYTDERFHGLPCYGAIDLASKQDLNAWVKLFWEDEICYLSARFWIPEDSVKAKKEEDPTIYEMYVDWNKRGFLEFTPGNTSDYNRIQKSIEGDFKDFKVVEAAYDPWNANQMAINLQDFGFKMIEFPQTLRNFNEPTKEMERLVLMRSIRHNNNPVLNWMAGNLSVRTDVNGSVRPVKPDGNNRKLKVDGMVAAIMTVGLKIKQGFAGPSVYEERGILTI
jgi:phage terminase large subunit-like protein